MPSDLARLSADRDYYRARANWQPGLILPICRDTSRFSPADHDACSGIGCGCECHRPTDAERALWTKLADEIDAYLDGDDEPLFGEAPC